jgi:hypothetical protein
MNSAGMQVLFESGSGAIGSDSQHTEIFAFYVIYGEYRMNLNKTRIVVACAAAFAAQGAFAACVAYDSTAPQNFVNDCAPEAKLALAGASSVKAAVTAVVTADLFDTTNMPVISVKDTSTTYANNAANTLAWYGMSKPSLTGGVSKRLFVVYNSNNGSAAGVSAVLATKLDKKLATATLTTGVVGSLEGKETTVVTVGSSSEGRARVGRAARARRRRRPATAAARPRRAPPWSARPALAGEPDTLPCVAVRDHAAANPGQHRQGVFRAVYPAFSNG